ncbi:putative bifunctional diguanylate cyclase/phosphodiesterase [Roseibium aggregatum]|uniref:EAL domain-containing protein n=1 Tax=Roseibium aggregatum TaxID=187304 RepID=A0A939EF63_9HYPH|nr:EAL domain-containing protein [Roseibium aggregatum]MBN9672121.1 EAL domain-containing protein [Roseibium aggregatum]
MHRSFFTVLLSAVFLLIVLVTFRLHESLHDTQSETIGRTMQYDAAWNGANGRLEFYQLIASAQKFLLDPSETNLRDTELRYDILVSRISVWEGEGFQAFLGTRPDLREVFNELKHSLTDLESSLRDLSDPARLETFLATLEDLKPNLDRLASEAYRGNLELNATAHADLLESFRLEALFFIGVLSFETLLLVIALLQNNSLSAANRRIRKNAEELAFLAHNDSLTGLPNRDYFKDILKETGNTDAQDHEIAVFALDLDGFNVINDTVGHSGGDALLTAVAERLKRRAVRLDSRNVVARLGGDEFLLLVHKGHGAPGFDEIAGSIIDWFSEPFRTEAGNMLVHASVGYTVVTPNEEDPQNILKDADLALNAAKAGGRGGIAKYDLDMRQLLEQRTWIEKELDFARWRNEIVPYYQPQIDLESGEVVGYEALARWDHPRRGLLGPDAFIKIAEISGDIAWMGEGILRAACTDIQQISTTARVSVNLSIAQLVGTDIVSTVKRVLEETGLPPRRLTLEITESIAMLNEDLIFDALRELQKTGIAIALDDFGTGYSSLSKIGQFRWDELKIDKSFVPENQGNEVLFAIVEFLRKISRQIDCKLVVEGVETEAQRDLFAKLGCQIAQGYLFGQPAPAWNFMDAQAENVRQTAGKQLSRR